MSAFSRRFTLADHRQFAALSGDVNPLHVDPSWAATVYPGKPATHGLHILLWALDNALATLPGRSLAALEVVFIKPVIADDSVVARVSDDCTNLRAFVDDEQVMVAKLFLTEGALRLSETTCSRTRPSAFPRRHDVKELSTLSGIVPLPDTSDALARAFPAVASALGPTALLGLAGISTLVGMECPGERSLLCELNVKFKGEPPNAPLFYRVTKWVPAFSRITMDIVGCGLVGNVGAFAGPKAQTEPTGAALSSLVSSDEFAGQRPIIIGGSGGLGSVTARLLAAGGARPLITWHHSRAAGEVVHAAIRAAGHNCELAQLDVSHPSRALAELEAVGWDGDQIYYFATPRIVRRRLKTYQADDMRDFMDVFVDHFYALVCSLMKARDGRALTVFYPSTTAVTETPVDMFEYALAKQVGEQVCIKLSMKYPNLRVVVKRLPRLNTRQTRGFIEVASKATEHVMIPIIRSVQGMN